jgi:poly(beta-D-mannuronate) lyase
MILRLFTFAVSCVALSASAGTAADKLPADVLDLRNWKLTLPERVDGDRDAREIAQPELAGYVHPDAFFVNDDGNGVVFRARCGGATTKGSSYPRSELREMTAAGKRAAWSTTDAVTHTMTVRLAIMATPLKKPHVVCAQIHDAADDLLMVRLEGRKLLVERNDVGDVVIDPDYQLGTQFDLVIAAGQGHVRVDYNGRPASDWKVERDGCYFKTGVYTQSNPKKGDTADAFGEVVIYRLVLESR